VARPLAIILYYRDMYKVCGKLQSHVTVSIYYAAYKIIVYLRSCTFSCRGKRRALDLTTRWSCTTGAGHGLSLDTRAGARIRRPMGSTSAARNRQSKKATRGRYPDTTCACARYSERVVLAKSGSARRTTSWVRDTRSNNNNRNNNNNNYYYYKHCYRLQRSSR